MNVLLTGANGFIGTYIKYNIDKKYNLLLASTSLKKDISKNQLTLSSNYSDVSEILNSYHVDCIIHTASIIPNSFDDSNYELFLKNIEMMNNLYSFSVKNNIKKFIYLSSFGSMKNPAELDIKDFYTMSKIVGEHFCSMMRSKKIHATSLRIPSPYGEHQKVNNVFKIFVKKALKNEEITLYGKGEREQNFIYVGNILHAIELLLEKSTFGNYDLVSENNLSMKELAEAVITKTQSESKLIYLNVIDDNENYRPSYSAQKIKNELGYIERYSFDKSLENYISWVKYEDSNNC